MQVSLADLVTVANAVCGLLAIALVAADSSDRGGLPEQTVLLAGALIVGGGLLDSVDGAVARWRGGSGLGEHLEVMSDAITFGLAPAVLLCVDAGAYGAPWKGLAFAAAACYLVGALLRLARYASAHADGGHELVGLPSPPAAMAATSVVVLHPPAPVALCAMLALGTLMIASFSFPTISAGTAPLMGLWWVFAGAAVAGLVPAWWAAGFTLAVLTGVLLYASARNELRRTRRAEVAADPPILAVGGDSANGAGAPEGPRISSAL